MIRSDHLLFPLFLAAAHLQLHICTDPAIDVDPIDVTRQDPNLFFLRARKSHCPVEIKKDT